MFRREFRRIICCNSGEKIEDTQQASNADTTRRTNTLSSKSQNLSITQQAIESEDFECRRMNDDENWQKKWRKGSRLRPD